MRRHYPPTRATAVTHRSSHAVRLLEATNRDVGFARRTVTQGDEWAPTPVLPIVANLLDDEVRFRFTAIGIGSAWVVDDVYAVPYGKG